MKRFLIAAAALAIAPFAYAADITVTYSDDFAEELEENYGMREGELLAGKTVKYLERELAKTGKDAARIEVVIIDAKPNRPTFKQLGDTPGLDALRSISIGGMELSATIYDASGTQIGDVSYDWFESDIRQVIGSATWTDAGRASQRFARKVAKAL